ncbi:GNAT family N-acetyltransferase [Actinomadura latina]|uniref:GNAT family N-acetyltransferase n=1 Tax=Actinomadura latina TaxID=163603 RepID=A0A846YS64_9ACTN|nr:GNAT family protein [Actinomadura latina]NKZ03680.1 GNAT family N-acetyltransferase [Actinomadura latina]
MNAFEGTVRLVGERLVLRPFGLDDAGTLIEVIRAGEGFLPPNFPTVLEAEPIAWFLQEGVHKVQHFGLGIHLAVTERYTGDLIGTIGLFKVDWSHLTSEVGYGMRSGARGRGYATEALRLVSDWALHDCGLFRVELRAMVTNHASVRVAEKAGYLREGVARGAERDADGASRDMIVFSRIATDPPLSGAPLPHPGGASARLVADDEEGRNQ